MEYNKTSPMSKLYEKIAEQIVVRQYKRKQQVWQLREKVCDSYKAINTDTSTIIINRLATNVKKNTF